MHGEFYLTDMASILSAAGERVLALQAQDPDEVLGADTIAETMGIDAKLPVITAQRLMAEGVTFRPETTVIDTGVMVGADSVIEPFVQLLGDERSAGMPDSLLLRTGARDDWQPRCGSPRLLIIESRVHDGAVLGPYAHLRPESEIGEGAHVGNFVETEEGSSGERLQSRSPDVPGDSDIGEDVNVGAATTCNYDGVSKHKQLSAITYSWAAELPRWRR